MKSRSSKAAKAREFNKKARDEIFMRDKGECIFCQISYHMEGATWYSRELRSIMHYIPRSRNGLGIPENGAIGCQYHHDMLDNGNQGHREEMLEIFRDYLKNHYKNWNEERLIYSRWR